MQTCKSFHGTLECKTAKMLKLRMREKYIAFSKITNLLHAEVCMSVGNGLAVLMRQGVQHGVVWMHGRKAVALQLFTHNADQLFHTGIIIRPVTHNLQTVSKVAIGIWKVWFQLECCSVWLEREKSNSFKMDIQKYKINLPSKFTSFSYPLVNEPDSSSWSCTNHIWLKFRSGNYNCFSLA